jgi:hypothetical protein
MTTKNQTSPSGEELKPCPFCGGKAVFSHNEFHGDDSMAVCSCCGATAFWRKWNGRADPRAQHSGEDAANGATLPAWFDTFLTNVCEIPDRNSPEDEPEAMIATAEELRNCAINAIEHFECQRSALTDPLQGWSVYVERNDEHFLTISNNHIAGAEITDELAALVRTAAAHLLSFAGNGQDHAGGYVGLSAEKTLSTNGAIGERLRMRLKVEKLASLLTQADATKQDIVNEQDEVTGARIGWGAWALLRAAIIDLIESKCESDARAALTAEKVAAEPTNIPFSAYRLKVAEECCERLMSACTDSGCPDGVNMADWIRQLAASPQATATLSDAALRKLVIGVREFILGYLHSHVKDWPAPYDHLRSDAVTESLVTDARDQIATATQPAQVALTDDARDALRYRWLRDFNVRCKDGVNINPPCEHVHASMYSHAIGAIPAVRLVTGEELDRAIDAALLAAQPVSGGKS